ncbi:SDR family oxidoreductase [Paenibacillus radicis (ex Xue et al. 2023)]|uniref:SDR family oxidoreductase n=1 Tax=Paenibacillus radicis (ex Xue et al. 2023) TaxID=2972489 RepID=A0ABT1YJT5_9BACL|nr:SDR family oxidoreductase [Paenibacillus radicis (ex Xue et al. 2023)]MCR8633421.1 SDR family oxidoreductase [Paenibacillus radicis (ex Xue et al. 2023)]
MELTGIVAVVSGASSGVGLATLKALVQKGAYVVALARNEQNLIQAIESIHPDLKKNIITIATDVRNETSVKIAIDHAATQFGHIDILINAAGVSMSGKQLVQEIDLAEWNRIMETNLTGTFLMCREALLKMTERNSGYIINILSTAAFQVSGGNSIYAASKFGARALTEAMIAANRRSGIRVTSISPGAIDTNIWSHKLNPVSQESRDTMLKAESIADIVLFLVSQPPEVHIENITVTPWYR